MKTNRIGNRNLTIEEVCDWLDNMKKNDAISLDEAHDLGKLIRILFEDNKMIYGSEGEYVRDQSN